METYLSELSFATSNCPLGLVAPDGRKGALDWDTSSLDLEPMLPAVIFLCIDVPGASGTVFSGKDPLEQVFCTALLGLKTPQMIDTPDFAFTRSEAAMEVRNLLFVL